MTEARNVSYRYLIHELTFRRSSFQTLLSVGLSTPAAGANVCNVVLMRHWELLEGISVLDQDGNVVGTSRVAARHVRVPVPLLDHFSLPLNFDSVLFLFCSDLIPSFLLRYRWFLQALLETALTRVILPMPILLLPPIVMSFLEK